MSSGWFGRALASAKDAASLGGVLTSVAEAANDRVKRVGQALHARVTGRHSFEDAVARVERAARDCPPAERGAMLRRWLAALRGLDAEDEAVAARLHEARSPPSEEATKEEAKKLPGAGTSSAPDAEEEKDIPEAPAAPATEASSSPPGSPSDPDAEWADVQMPAHGRTVAPVISATAEDRVSIDVVVDAANASGASVLRFRSERAKEKSGDKGVDDDDDDDDERTFDFRDVLLRSRCLENLVASFARAPAAEDDEARVFLEFVDALVFAASPASEADANLETSSVATSLIACVARAGAALRDPKRTAEVQLGDDTLVAMLSTCAGSVKKIGAAETLLRRERRLRWAFDANADTVRLLSASPASGASHDAGAGPSETLSGKEPGSTDSTATAPRESLEKQKKQTHSADDLGNVVDDTAFVVRAVTPTSALAAATRLGVDLSRRAHDHAAARALRLAAESELSPTEDALVRCRASLETLAHASTDVAGLSEQSRNRLLEAETFREEKLRECLETETKKRDAAETAERKRAELAAALAKAEAEASKASEEAERAVASRRAFEESAEAVRETLERKVRDLSDRAEEYQAESRAISVVRDSLREIARIRVSSLEAASAAAADDVASARLLYVEAARAHGEGQAGAARLCLARLRFCKKELEETRRKRAEALSLGIRGGSSGSSGVKSASSEKSTFSEKHAESREGSLSRDLQTAQRSIERAYVEAEEGAKAVFAAAEASRREAFAIAPAATKSSKESLDFENARPGDPPGYLAAVFGDIDDARAAFAAEAATRPALEIEETRNEDHDDDDDDSKFSEKGTTSTSVSFAEKDKEHLETEGVRSSARIADDEGGGGAIDEPASDSATTPLSKTSARDGPPASSATPSTPLSSATDPLPDPERSDAPEPLPEPSGPEPRDGGVPPVAPPEDPTTDSPSRDKSSSTEPTGAAGTTGDDIDDWLSDD